MYNYPIIKLFLSDIRFFRYYFHFGFVFTTFIQYLHPHIIFEHNNDMVRRYTYMLTYPIIILIIISTVTTTLK